MKKIIILMCMLITANVQGAVLKKGSAMCLSETSFHQLLKAGTKQDHIAVTYIMTHECLFTKAAMEVAILRVSPMQPHLFRIDVLVPGDKDHAAKHGAAWVLPTAIK